MIEVWSWDSIKTGIAISIPPSEVKLIKPNFPHNCISLDLTKNKLIKEQGVKNIYITFHKRSGYGVEIFLEDKQISCSRTIIYSRLTHSGANIGLDDLGNTVIRRYVVKVDENIRLEENPQAKCRNYPNKGCMVHQTNGQIGKLSQPSQLSHPSQLSQLSKYFP